MIDFDAFQIMVESRSDINGQIKENILRSAIPDMKKSELTANPAAAGGGPGGPGPQPCAGCGGMITDRFMLRAVNKFWHEDCLKCGACDCRLGEVGSTLYEKANLILCRRDYLRLFGSTGYCAACSRLIPAFEMVMRAREHVYHLECFACQQCNHRFCVGDRFYLCDGRILCEYDYEERRMFAAFPQSQGSLDHIKRQVNNIQNEPCTDPTLPITADTTGSSTQPRSRRPQQQQQQTRRRQQRRCGPGADDRPGPAALYSAMTSRPTGDDASSGYGSPDSVTMDTR